MSTFGVWWCNYTDIRNYSFEKGYTQERINEMEYHLNKCKREKEDEKKCKNIQESLDYYFRKLEKIEMKSKIAEKKCELWNMIAKLDEEERNIS